MKHLFTLGIAVLAGQMGFAGAYLLKIFVGKQLALRLSVACVAMLFMKMLEIRDRLF